jgi:hypothetical protein
MKTNFDPMKTDYDPDERALLQAAALRARGGQPIIELRTAHGKVVSIDVRDGETGALVGENPCQPIHLRGVVAEAYRAALQGAITRVT